MVIKVKRGKSKSVCIVGIYTDYWYVRDENTVGYGTVERKKRIKDSLYVDSIGKIIAQQMGKEGGEKIDFLLEGKKEKESIKFPFKLFNFCKDQENKNSNFSYKNIWDEKVGVLCRFVYNLAEKNNKSNEWNRLYGFHTIGEYKGHFVNVKNKYDNIIELLKKNNITKITENLFLKKTCDGLLEIIKFMDCICTKFGGKQSIFCSLRQMKKDSLGAKLTLDLVDNISSYYWFACYFSELIFSQFGNDDPKITIIICNVIIGELLGKALFALGCYKGKFLDNPQEQKMYKNENEKGKVFSDLQIKTFINHSIKSCNWCGASSKKCFCSKCRMAFYCDSNCQRNDWQYHKEFCEAHKSVMKSQEEKQLRWCSFCGYETADVDAFCDHMRKELSLRDSFLPTI